MGKQPRLQGKATLTIGTDDSVQMAARYERLGIDGVAERRLLGLADDSRRFREGDAARRRSENGVGAVFSANVAFVLETKRAAQGASRL